MLRPVATTALPAARAALAMSTPIPRPAPVINHTFFPLVGPSRRACKDVAGRRSSCLSDIAFLPYLVKLLYTIKAQIACKHWGERLLFETYYRSSGAQDGIMISQNCCPILQIIE